MIKAIRTALWASVGLVLGLGAALADTKQALDSTKNLCTAPIRKWERELQIPAYLLEAISRAESGRWDPVDRASFAWPWTVTSGGDGTYYDTKAQALAAVKALKDAGKTNIDVGCMQINLYYHKTAFQSLEEAFDPNKNVEYAARFLAQLCQQHKSWTEAAAAYHSTTPDLNKAYKTKVIALWNGLRDQRMASADAKRESQPAPARSNAGMTTLMRPTPAAGIDRARTEELNRRLRETRAAARGVELAASKLNRDASVRAGQLAVWREKQAASLDMIHADAMWRSEQALMDAGLGLPLN
jgi:hypothetical protein